jgi:cysteine desulfurase
MEAVYLDYAATTPVSDEVRSAMAPYQTDRFGNPSSLHRWGRVASAALEEARATAAEALGARPAEIHFVRGGTESDNLAILGTCRALSEEGTRPRLLISAVEHHAVFETAEHAVAIGLADLTTVPVSPEGDLDWDLVRGALPGGPAVVSTMWVNNETGMVLPVPELTALAKTRGATVHTDASQAVGKVPVDVSEVPVDLLTATGHKIYGPKGTGLLYVRAGTSVSPLLHGGGQERALRPGTEDVAGAVGFATALKLAVESQASQSERLRSLRAELETRLATELTGVRINAGGAERAPHVSSVAFSEIPDGQALLMALDLAGVAVSGGSACASGSQHASHVIAALYGADDTYATVRFSFGHDSTEDVGGRAVTATVDVVRRLRAA